MILDFIGGKIASYYLNAHIDARIAQKLLTYVQSGEPPQGDDPAARRARLLIDDAPADAHHQRVVMRAYTERHLNGHADMVLAGLLERWAGLEVIEELAPWQPTDITLRCLFFPWLGIFFGDFEHAKNYARTQADLDLTLPPAEIVREFMAVQRINIRVNHENQGQLRRISDTSGMAEFEKIQRLYSLAERFRRPDTFLWSAARTQMMASRWDWLFMTSLKLRFRVSEGE